MSTYSNKGGRPRTASRKTKGGKTSRKQKSVKDAMMVQVKRRKRVKEVLCWPWHITPGQHVRPIVLEAMEILKSEGWVIGKILDPDIPFDIIGIFGKASIFVKAVKAKSPITNAKETANAYYKDLKKIQPFWNSDTDNLQFWVFSRVGGLLRYQVYRGGIWNEATRAKPDSQELWLEPVSHRMRAAA